jgi:LacI family transcriptional regulator
MIARETKLSTTTVSLVLNNLADKVGIRPETQERVWEAAKRLNYKPNPLAVGLKGGKTHTIGLIWSLGGPHAAGMMTHDLTERLQKRGYLTHLADHGSDPELTGRLLEDFGRRHVDGIVLEDNSHGLFGQGATLRQLKNFSGALLVSSCQPSEGLEIDHIFHDRLPAFLEAADHFARSGRRRPAMVGMWPPAQQKAAAFLGQARRHGMEIQPGAEIDIGSANRIEAIASLCRATLEKRFNGNEFPFDAIMCTSDEMAIVVIAYLHRRGLRVPQDVTVVGFNDSPLAPHLPLPLASGDRRDGEVAAAIADMMLHRLEHPEAPPQRKSIPMRFVWRDSAGEPCSGNSQNV